jgi:Uma2 family endonuclease
MSMAHEAKTGFAVTSASDAPPTRMTYEEFLALDEEGARLEWVDGEVVRMSAVTDEHEALKLFLLRLLADFAEFHQLGRVLGEPFQMKTGPHLPGRAPDIFFVASEHSARLKRMYLDGPADAVVEIISPDSRQRDRRRKFREYKQGGVREYWLIDQPRKQAEFYQLGDDGVCHLAPLSDDGIFRNGVLPGFWLKLEWLWQEPRPPVLTILREWGLI